MSTVLTFEQKKEFYRNWVTALRSGKYKQKHGDWWGGQKSDRKKPNSFCCLSIACDIIKPDTDFRKLKDGNIEDLIYPFIEYWEPYAELNDGKLEYSDKGNPVYRDTSSFIQIADYIEAKHPEYFKD